MNPDNYNDKYDNDNLINYCVKEMVYQAIIKGFKRNGIEGTEQIINRDKNEKRRNLMLNGYKELKGLIANGEWEKFIEMMNYTEK